MINWLDKKHAHEWEDSPHQRVHINLYAHNSWGFDSYMVLWTSGIKFKTIIKSNSNILLLDVLTESCKIHFMCTLSHIPGSLEKLCKNFKIDENKSKLNEKEWGFSWDQITKDSWREFLPLIIPYLKLDVISLGEVWKKFITI